ncbi:MAG: RNA polymerase sporulation sigma factor SigE [Clostridia bacterium]|nr:RNA polymerase sporulation sigma factor SigE [Clostridia bacterium]
MGKKWKVYLQQLLQILRGWLGVPPKDVYYIGGNETLPNPLGREEEELLLSKLDQPTEREEAKKTLIERNLRLVVYIARKFENTGIGIEDLISIGTIGLIKAINTFKTDKKIKLATYASRCIENEILMCLRKNNGIKTEVSIDEPLNVDWDGNELLLSDILGTEEDIIWRGLDEEVDKQLLRLAMEKLSQRERRIMELRFGLKGGESEKTQKEVADMLGISQSYISRLEKRIILRLRRDITKMIHE